MKPGDVPQPEEDTGEGDPLDYPRDECGAQAKEPCRPWCTALPD